MPAVFVRLAGCHLKCYFCDTDFLTKRKTQSLNDVLNAVTFYPVQQYPLVVVTGGEPMRQNISPLCLALAATGRKVQVETAGSFGFMDANADAHPNIYVVVSPKTAHVDSSLRATAHAWKYIVGSDTLLSEEDGLPLSSTQERGRRATLARPHADTPRTDIWLQPQDDGADAPTTQVAIARCVYLAQRYGYRLSVQIHKIVGVP